MLMLGALGCQGRCTRFGGHLGVNERVHAGTLGNTVHEDTFQVISVGALCMEFQRILCMVCSKCPPAG